MFIIQNPATYVVAYLALMVPTYILPYFGSNSTLINAFSAAAGMGPIPQWWAHVWFLTMLALLGWLRGAVIGKAFLPLFPALAGVFDIVPGLSAIPLVPTLLHVAGIILGASNSPQAQAEGLPAGGVVVLKKAKWIASVTTLLAVCGSLLFVSTMGRTVKSLTAPPAVSPLTTVPAPSQPAASQPYAPAAKSAATSIAVVEAGNSSRPLDAPKVSASASEVNAPQVSRKVERKSAEPAKPTVRYINLND